MRVGPDRAADAAAQRLLAAYFDARRPAAVGALIRKTHAAALRGEQSAERLWTALRAAYRRRGMQRLELHGQWFRVRPGSELDPQVFRRALSLLFSVRPGAPLVPGQAGNRALIANTIKQARAGVPDARAGAATLARAAKALARCPSGTLPGSGRGTVPVPGGGYEPQ